MKHLKLIFVILGGLILALVGMNIKNSNLRKKIAKTKFKLNEEIHENQKDKLETSLKQTQQQIKNEQAQRGSNEQHLKVLDGVKKKELNKIFKLEKQIKKDKEEITDIDKALKASKKL